MIILNEKEYVEELLIDKRLGEIPTLSLNLIAKYLRQYKGLTHKKIVKELNDFMISSYVGYNPLDWSEYLEKCAKKSKDRDLIEIDGVHITQYELDKIAELKNKSYEKLAFTILCLAKYGNARNENNNCWVNNDFKEIFKLARVSCNASDRKRRLNKLYTLGYISFAKRIDNMSIHAEFVNDDSENVIYVCDFRELGYEYLLYKGENFIRCKECGILTRGNKKGNKKYCKNCMGYVPELTRKITCVDCGNEFIVSSNVGHKVRCDECQKEYRKQYWAEHKRKKRKNSI